MGQRRMTRADLPPDPAGVMRALRACRQCMIDVQTRVRPTGPTYHGAAMVVAAIDAFATLLTGERHYFYADGSTASEERKLAVEDRRAREDGEKPWQS